MVKNQKGITLIALIITIIVMLILAAVAIRMATGENGVIGKARDAKKDQMRADMKTAIQLAYAQLVTDYHADSDNYKVQNPGATNESVIQHYFTTKKLKDAYFENGGPELESNSTTYDFNNNNVFVDNYSYDLYSNEYDSNEVGIRVTFSHTQNSVPVINSSTGIVDLPQN